MAPGPNTPKRSQLISLIGVGVALTARDIQLWRHGGGVTPRWMLATETFASAASAALGMVALRALRSTQAACNDYARLSKMTAVAALSLHTARVAIYLKHHRILEAAPRTRRP